MSDPLSVAVLAGGESTRLGLDKAFVHLKEDGPSIIEAVLGTAHEVSRDVMIIAAKLEPFKDLDARLVADVFPYSGSLGGIYTGLHEAKNDYCLVLACDMPFLSLPLLKH